MHILPDPVQRTAFACKTTKNNPVTEALIRLETRINNADCWAVVDKRTFVVNIENASVAVSHLLL
jgi:hypothetical protein